MANEYKIKGYLGKWSKVDSSYYKGEEVHLMESCTYGDEAAMVIVAFRDNNPVVIMDDVYNGFDDLQDL